ncbi:MAG: ribosome silencing factor [Rhodospirillales bacterium]|nr:ribosome silencing factor [Rhodospirillales bacterium]
MEKSLDDDKAIDVKVIDLRNKTAIADYMVIATGTSPRHLATMAEHLIRTIKSEGHGTAPVEGQSQGDWVLVDAGDVIVHLFRAEVRTFYNLERLWEISEPGATQTVNHTTA